LEGLHSTSRLLSHTYFLLIRDLGVGLQLTLRKVEYLGLLGAHDRLIYGIIWVSLLGLSGPPIGQRASLTTSPLCSTINTALPPLLVRPPCASLFHPTLACPILIFLARPNSCAARPLPPRIPWTSCWLFDLAQGVKFQPGDRSIAAAVMLLPSCARQLCW
jgi:hypothetical protein